MREELENITKNVLYNEPMKNHTTFRIGGPADIFVCPTSEAQVGELISLFGRENYPYMVIGNGSNMLVSDKGIRGAVIQIGKEMSDCEIEGNMAYAKAGILMSQLSSKLLEASLSGFEKMSGIPGTLGGGIFMNAGAYGAQLSDVIKEVTFLSDKGQIKTLNVSELNMGYRRSIFQTKPYVILSALMELKRADKDEIRARIEEYRKQRNDKQPINMPSAGSTFKRPEGHFAGKLIEDAGLMGYTIGGAQVSKKHAGFIVNTGDATADDVMRLIEYVQKTVRDKFNVSLEPEVRLIGER